MKDNPFISFSKEATAFEIVCMKEAEVVLDALKAGLAFEHPSSS